MYGGSLFSRLRSHGDQVFVSIPAIVPSRRSERPVPSAPDPTIPEEYPRSPVSPPVNMGSYMESGGCFGSPSTVQVSRNGSFHETRVPDVKPGDLVKVAGAKKFGNQGQNVARVRCVVVYPVDPSMPLIGLPGGCVLTKDHPVRIDGLWRKPQDVGIPTPNASNHVWNFVLESSHILLVNGMECCTLGHGFQEEGVRHEYWGGRVLDDLSKISGWAQGYVKAFSEKDAEGHTIKLSASTSTATLPTTHVSVPLSSDREFGFALPPLCTRRTLQLLAPIRA